MSHNDAEREVHDAAREIGIPEEQAARLLMYEAKAHRDLLGHVVAFMDAVTARSAVGQSPSDSWSPQELDALAEQHGLRMEADGFSLLTDPSIKTTLGGMFGPPKGGIQPA